MFAHFRRTPLTARPRAGRAAARPRAGSSASAESYSLWSTLKMPTTVNCFRRGMRPAGVTWPCGAMSVTRSPTCSAQRAREVHAEHDAELARAQVLELARRSCACRCRRPGPRARARRRARRRRAPPPRWRAGPAPRRTAPRRSPRGSSAPRRRRPPSPRGPSRRPVTWMCAATPRMRARISFSKPFITDITVISAAMPSAIPRIEMNEMNEMKWLRRLARV